MPIAVPGEIRQDVKTASVATEPAMIREELGSVARLLEF
jgi:hypothetical protein